MTGQLDGVRVSYTDRDTRTYAVERVENLPDGALTNATQVTLLGENFGGFSHEFGGPGETTLTVEQTGVPTDARFVIMAFAANGSGPINVPLVLDCKNDGRVTSVEITVTDEGPSHTFFCGL